MGKKDIHIDELIKTLAEKVEVKNKKLTIQFPNVATKVVGEKILDNGATLGLKIEKWRGAYILIMPTPYTRKLEPKINSVILYKYKASKES